MIRSSTLKTLLSFHNGDKTLSSVLNQSMSSDPINPVLLDKHLLALDRRLGTILGVVRDCVSATENPKDVIFPRDEDYDNVKPDQEVDDGHFFG